MTKRIGRERKARSTGIYVRTGAGPDDYEYRSVGAGSGIVITNPDGIDGPITIAATGGGGGAPTTASYVVVGLDAGLSAERRLQVGTGLSLTDGGAGGNLTVAPDLDLAAVEALASNGLAARTATSTWTTRSIATADPLVLTVTDGDGVAGNPTIALDTGAIVADGLQAPADGVVLTTPGGAGLPSVLSLTGDLAAVEGLSGTGIAVRSGATPTWDLRSIAVSGTGLSIANASGAAGNPTVTLDAAAALGQISTTQGAVLYRNASAWVALGPGTSGDVLTTQGAGANPTWAPAAGGGGGLSAAQVAARVVVGV